MEPRSLFVMTSPGWPLGHTLGGQGCMHDDTRLWVLGKPKSNPCGVTQGKPTSVLQVLLFVMWG